MSPVRSSSSVPEPRTGDMEPESSTLTLEQIEQIKELCQEHFNLPTYKEQNDYFSNCIDRLDSAELKQLEKLWATT